MTRTASRSLLREDTLMIRRIAATTVALLLVAAPAFADGIPPCPPNPDRPPAETVTETTTTADCTTYTVTETTTTYVWQYEWDSNLWLWVLVENRDPVTVASSVRGMSIDETVECLESEPEPEQPPTEPPAATPAAPVVTAPRFTG